MIILVCGQDNVGTVEIIEEIKYCEHLFCASPCEISAASLGRKGKMINIIDFIETDNGVQQKSCDMEYLKTKQFLNGICGGGLSMIK